MQKKIDGNQVLYQILKEEKVDLLKFIIESSFFSKKEDVENDKKNMIDELTKNNPLYIRHKSAIKELIKTKDKKSIRTKALALKYQKDNKLKYDFNGNLIYVKFDSDNNYEIKKKIKENTTFSVSSGKATSHLTNYKISHIWNYTSHPLYFSALWNVIVVPKCLDHFIDDTNIEIQHAHFPKKKLNTKLFFMALVTVLYDLQKFEEENKIFEVIRYFHIFKAS